jgi:pilus assembly protein Flp/PilA
MGPQDMHRLIPRLSEFLQDETGQDLIEYALLAGLIGIGAILTLKALDAKIVNAFGTIGNKPRARPAFAYH